MICYKDRQFCKFWEDCQDSNICDRALTPEVQAAADKWWEGFKNTDHSAPININMSKPQCHKLKTK